MAKEPEVRWVQAPDGTWHPLVPPSGPATSPKPKSNSNAVGCGLIIFLVFIVVAIIGALGGGSTSKSDGSGLACDHFRHIAGDVSKGILTDAELRAKLQEVRNDASIASPAVQTASTKMLAASTAGDVNKLIGGVEEMDKACKAAGH